MVGAQTKQKLLEADLIGAIKNGEIPPSGKLPSISQVAKEYKVSLSTVYQVFSKLQREGYITMSAGKGTFANDHSVVKRKIMREKGISLIIPNVKGPLLLEVIHGVEKYVSANNYFLTIFNSLDNFDLERENLKKAIELNSTGVVLFPVTYAKPFWPNYDLYKQIREMEVPLIFIGAYPMFMDTDYIIADDYKGFYELANHLITKGHKKIAFFGGPLHISSPYNRFKGFWQAMTDAGLEINNQWVFPNNGVIIEDDDMTATDFYRYKGAEYMLKILNSSQRPSALIFTQLNSEYVEILKKFKIPEQLSICTRGLNIDIDYLNVSNYLKLHYDLKSSIEVTHTAFHPFSLGQKAAKVILDKIENKIAKNGLVQIKIDTPLLIGNSVKKLETKFQVKGKQE